MQKSRLFGGCEAGSAAAPAAAKPATTANTDNQASPRNIVDFPLKTVLVGSASTHCTPPGKRSKLGGQRGSLVEWLMVDA